MINLTYPLFRDIIYISNEREDIFMKDRLAPCIHYICRGQCSKGFEAEQKGICQHCKKYQARKGFKVIDKRKKDKERYYE